MPLPGEREGNGNGFRLVVKGLVKGHTPASFDLQVRVCKGGGVERKQQQQQRWEEGGGSCGEVVDNIAG